MKRTEFGPGIVPIQISTWQSSTCHTYRTRMIMTSSPRRKEYESASCVLVHNSVLLMPSYFQVLKTLSGTLCIFEGLAWPICCLSLAAQLQLWGSAEVFRC